MAMWKEPIDRKCKQVEQKYRKVSLCVIVATASRYKPALNRIEKKLEKNSAPD